MCDTFVIHPTYTKGGNMILGKNSDRDPDEVQNVIFIKGQERNLDEEKEVQCTYIKIPQVKKTYDIILSQPFWMFGGEMGANQQGLVIGNEAVFTTEPLNDIGLTGMDMIRLALERKSSAKDALDFIIYLLEEYGQGGGCGYHDRTSSYHNSWIIADNQEAYVLESAGVHWVWKEIKKNYSISNILTIESDYDGISGDAIKNAIEKGKCTSENDFSFRRCYMAKGLKMVSLQNKGAKGDARIALHNGKVCNYIDDNSVDAYHVMEILRSHQIPKKNQKYNPGIHGSMADVCMHSNLGLFRPSSSVNSFIAEIDMNKTIIWTTCGSAPCIQIFKPLVLFKEGVNKIPPIITVGNELYDEKSIWWRNERFHRLVLQDYTVRLDEFSYKRDIMEKEWFENSLIATKKDFHKFSEGCFEKAEEFRDKWYEKLKNMEIKGKNNKKFVKSWNKMSERNKLFL